MTNELKIGFVGVGQCGGNIANEFSKLGYPAIAINTAKPDLDKLTNIRNENRLLINLGIQGAGKNPEIGENAFVQHNEVVTELIYNAFGEDVDMLYVCAGFGGGTGSGVAPILSALLCELGYNVGVIATLPTRNESQKVQLVALNAFQKMSENDGISSFFIIDNDKTVDSNIGVKTQYNVTNVNIVRQFDGLYKLTEVASDMAFDARDFITLLSNRGVASMAVVQIDDLKNFGEIALQKISESIKNGLFADTELAGANGCAIVFEIGNGSSVYVTQEIVGKIQAALGNPFDIFTAIYESDNKKQDRSATLRLLITGLPIPKDRLDGMNMEFERRQETLVQKQQKANDIRYTSKSSNYLNSMLNTNTPAKTQQKKTGFGTGGNSLLEEIAKRKAEMNKK